MRGRENNGDSWTGDGSEEGYTTCQSILSWDSGGWNGSTEQTLNGYRVDVARHDGVCGFADTNDSKILVRAFVDLGTRYGARE